LPEGAPGWLRKLASEAGKPDGRYVHRDVTRLYKTHGQHLLFDSLRKENAIREVYYFTENQIHTSSVPSPDKNETSPTLDFPEVVAVFHLGSEVCGHKGIIHGGLSAALCDEVMGTVSYIYNLGQPSFTANINLNYKKPLFANSWILIRSKVYNSEGRKVFIEAQMEDGNENQYVNGTALFIKPKNNFLNRLKQFLWSIRD